VRNESDTLPGTGTEWTHWIATTDCVQPPAGPKPRPVCEAYPVGMFTEASCKSLRDWQSEVRERAEQGKRMEQARKDAFQTLGWIAAAGCVTAVAARIVTLFAR